MVFFIIAVVLIKMFSTSQLFEAKSFKGRGYFVQIPEGWKKVKTPKGMHYPDGVEVDRFVPKPMAADELPEVQIIIFSKKLDTPVWIEDEFPGILESISREGYKIMDQGELKLDDKIAKWVVYQDKKTSAMNLEFYTVTDTSIFYKLQYSTQPGLFSKYRRAFEFLRESFKFRFSLY